MSITVKPDNATQAQLNRIEAMLTALTKGATTMTADMQSLATQVAQSITIEQSAVTLINGIAPQRSTIDDPEAVTLAQELQQSAAQLSAAITANTPAAGTTTTGGST